MSWLNFQVTQKKQNISSTSGPIALVQINLIASTAQMTDIRRSTVKDCEAIRKVLLGDKEKPEDRKWTILGQSFGGFCALTYLSFYSEGVKEVFTAGGLAPLVDSPDVVYAALIREYQAFYSYFILF